MTFAENIKRLRLARGMNKTKFAKLIGVSDAMIHHWEKGTNERKTRLNLAVKAIV